MPRVSKVQKLNEEDREWLNKSLVERGFSGYEELEQMCRERGIDISSSALHRHGKSFQERLEAVRLVTEQARAVVDHAPDEEGAVNEALMRMIQERLFTVVMEAEMNPGDISKVTKAIADLGRASVRQKRLAAEVRKEAREELIKEQEERLEDLRGSDGMSEELESRIKGILMGKQ